MHFEPDKVFRVLTASKSPLDKRITKKQSVGTFLPHPKMAVHSGLTSDSMLEKGDLQELCSRFEMDTNKPCSHSSLKRMNCSPPRISVVSEYVAQLKFLSGMPATDAFGFSSLAENSGTSGNRSNKSLRFITGIV